MRGRERPQSPVRGTRDRPRPSPDADGLSRETFLGPWALPLRTLASHSTLRHEIWLYHGLSYVKPCVILSVYSDISSYRDCAEAVEGNSGALEVTHFLSKHAPDFPLY